MEDGSSQNGTGVLQALLAPDLNGQQILLLPLNIRK